MSAAELRKLVKQLQSVSKATEIITILNTFKSEFQVNESILRETKAGLAVGKLRSHESKDVADLAKDLVKKWKGDVEKAKLSQPGKIKTTEKAKVAAAYETFTASPTTPTGTKANRTAKSDGVKISMGDTTRNKCAELIYDSLAAESNFSSQVILERAQAIEKAVFRDQGSTTATSYKAKIRVLFVNLKDKHNPSLRERVLNGELPPETLATMTSQEMASPERKAADGKIQDQNFFNSLGAGSPEAETDAFKCGRCGQRKTRYRQAQTRSADEPMTTYVTCTNCGYNWKF